MLSYILINSHFQVCDPGLSCIVPKFISRIADYSYDWLEKELIIQTVNW